jgi:hypothetical protein
VLKKPDDSALSVFTAGSGLGASAPPLGSGTDTGPVTGPSAAPAQPVGPVGGGAVLPPSGSATGGAAAAPPVVAPPSAGTGATGSRPVAATSVPGAGGLTTTQRRVLAGLVIALELLGFALLMGDRGVERLATAGGATGLVGGRLRPPDRGRRAGSDPVVAASGVGRFRSPRQGRPPRL